MATAHLSTFDHKSKYGILAHIAYITRSTIKDEQTGKKYYSHKSKEENEFDVLHSNILIPKNASTKFKNAQTLWNEAIRTGYDRIANTFTLGSPYEASLQENIALLERFLNDQFVENNYIVQYCIHNEKVEDGVGNKNVHAHVAVCDIPCIGEELPKARSGAIKTESYYADENGKKLEKVNTPVLKHKKLQRDKDGNIIYKKGWQKLQLDENGEPLLDKDGTPILKDIRILTGYREEGNYQRPIWNRKFHKIFPTAKKTGLKDLRQEWENYHNKFIIEHNIRDEKGRLAIIDMRSFAEQDKDKPVDERRIPQKKVWDKNNGIKKDTVLRNKKIAEHNENTMKIRELRERAAMLDIAVKKDEKQISNENEFVNKKLNPEQRWVSTWKNFTRFTMDKNTSMLGTFKQQLTDTIIAGNEVLKTSTDELEAKRIRLHQRIMLHLLKNINELKRTDIERIEKLAKQNYENLTDAEKTAWIRINYGEQHAKIFARTKARTSRKLNAYRGMSTKMKAPVCPTKVDMNTVNKMHNISYDNWNKNNLEAPPAELINVIRENLKLEFLAEAKLTKNAVIDSQLNNNIKITKEQVENYITTERVKRAQEAAEAKRREEEQLRQEYLKKQQEIEDAKAEAKRIAEQQIQQTQIVEIADTKDKVATTEDTKANEINKAIAKGIEDGTFLDVYNDKKLAIMQNIDKIKKEYFTAQANHDQDTIAKLREMVNYAYGSEFIKMKVKSAQQERKQEQDDMINSYVEKRYGYFSVTDHNRYFEAIKDMLDKTGKINQRKMNMTIDEYNDSTTDEFKQVDTKAYRKASDELNFWYNMQMNITSSGTGKGRANENTKQQTIEIQHPEPKHTRTAVNDQQTSTGQNTKALPEGKKDSSSVLPDGKVRLRWQEQDYHTKSEMEKAEDELYKGWNPATSDYVR